MGTFERGDRAVGLKSLQGGSPGPPNCCQPNGSVPGLNWCVCLLAKLWSGSDTARKPSAASMGTCVREARLRGLNLKRGLMQGKLPSPPQTSLVFSPSQLARISLGSTISGWHVQRWAAHRHSHGVGAYVRRAMALVNGCVPAFVSVS